jgi:aminopeptidase-like protein
LRATLGYIADRIPLAIQELPSGHAGARLRCAAQRSACIRRLDGEAVVDFARHSLHLLQYSQAGRGGASTR